MLFETADHSTPSSPLDLTELRLCLLGNGFTPLPVLSHARPGDGAGKGLHMKGWRTIDVTPEVIRGWGYGERQNDSNTGIRCGEVVGVDIDVYDKALSDRLRKLALDYFGGEPPIRIGQPPKCLMLYRTASPREKRATAGYKLPGHEDKKASRIEVLGEGQQLVGFGTHPVTLEPYRWIGPSLLEIKLHELPLVTDDAVDGFLNMAEQIIINAGGILTEDRPRSHEPRERPKETAPADPSAYDEIDDALSFCGNNVGYEEWAKIGAGIYNILG
jgi:putative DNA primase/helicase